LHNSRRFKRRGSVRAGDIPPELFLLLNDAWCGVFFRAFRTRATERKKMCGNIPDKEKEKREEKDGACDRTKSLRAKTLSGRFE